MNGFSLREENAFHGYLPENGRMETARATTLESLVIPCLSLVPFLSLLVCFLLFDEVVAAIRKTKKHFNSLVFDELCEHVKIGACILET